MKKLWFFPALLMILLVMSKVVQSSITGGVIETEVRTNTQVLIKITTLPVGTASVDSNDICYILPASSDTTFYSTIDATTRNSIVSDLEPGKQYIFFVRSMDDTGHTAISDKDTITMYYPEIEEYNASNILHKTEKVITATSWRPYNITESFTLNGTADTDSSAVYEPWKNNALIVFASQDGDSIKTMVYINYGYREMTQLGSWIGFSSPIDSLNITGVGVFNKTLTSNLAYPSMYFTLGSYVDNGANSSITMYLTRDRY